ncbi:MAG TPA: MFS transporter [Actinomycetota bacterium]|nr:MFS transporter [Actinomycetota bacterium]
MARTAARPPLLSRSYVLVCAATLLFYLATQMQIPLYPPLLRERAGASASVVGLFIGAYTVLAVLTRPMVGRELARRPRRLFMAAGGAVTVAATIGYWLAGSLAALIAIRVLHGSAVALFYTAASTTVADLAPAERRGEALSLFSMFLYLGLAAGPAIGLALHRAAGFGAMFAVSIGFAAACAAIALAIREPRLHSPEAREIERHPLVHRAALLPGAVLACAAVGYAAGLNFTVDYAAEHRIGGSAFYFPVLALSVIATRLVAGRASDVLGRRRVAAPGLALFAAAMATEALARGPAGLLASAAMFGIGFGMFFPTMMAFTTDRVSARERGSAMATFTASFDVGFGLGSPLLGAIHGAAGYPVMYAVAAGMAALGLLVLASPSMRSGARTG